MRILGNPRYPNRPRPPAVVAPLLEAWRNLPRHRFWHDRLSLLTPGVLGSDRLLDPSQITEVGAFYWTVPAPGIVNSGREEQGSVSV